MFEVLFACVTVKNCKIGVLEMILLFCYKLLRWDYHTGFLSLFGGSSPLFEQSLFKGLCCDGTITQW